MKPFRTNELERLRSCIGRKRADDYITIDLPIAKPGKMLDGKIETLIQSQLVGSQF